MPGLHEEVNIYRLCRERANQAAEEGSFNSRDKAEREFAKRGIAVSAASLKDYESGKTTPRPETVRDMAALYGTPELMWMHCSKECPIGQNIIKADDEIGTDDVVYTYFEIAGSLHKATRIEQQLREILEDRTVTEEEKPMMREILRVMDRIAENAKDLRIWLSKNGVDLEEE